ncbi:MAG: hypothetical protein M0Q53_16730 [Prolixibacteraceae bacterium]|jgi:hypothetical protein|nr:hypothetical protein [Prolixibacteraceae bacterium]
MKTLILFFLLILSFYSYGQNTNPDVDIHWEVDVTSIDLFSECRDDVQNNFSSFMKETGFGEVKPGQSLTMYWTKIAGTGALQSASASITGPSAKLAYQIQRKQLNPGKLIQLKNTQLVEFENFAKKNITNTSIIQVLIKDILEGDNSNRCYYIVFSDLVENSNIVNCYKSIPFTRIQIKTVVDKIDPYLKANLKQKLDRGFMPRLILVQKETNGKVDSQKIREFWLNLLHNLGIDNVQIIDNLTNKINR